MSEISIIRDLASGIKSFKISDEVDVGDEEDFILKLKSEVDSLRGDRDKITGIIVRQPPTASLPIKYKAKLNALLAGAVGFFFLVFLVFFIEYLINASKRTQKTNQISSLRL